MIPSPKPLTVLLSEILVALLFAVFSGVTLWYLAAGASGLVTIHKQAEALIETRSISAQSR